jgi:murein DD-endopeptidase MepM/ murein hydrolase activator NlpD
MTGNKWSFLLIRGENQPVKQYSVSTRTLRGLLVLGSLVTIFLIGLGLLSGPEVMTRLEARGLRARNEALDREFITFERRIEGLAATLDALADNDAGFRSIAGLEIIDPEVLQAGVGGPGLGSPSDSPLWVIDSTKAKTAFATSYDLSALERRARLLFESLEEATDSVLAHRDLLESIPSILPTAGRLSSRFSQARIHPLHNRPLPHEGVDISAPKGTPIFAAAKGTVARAGWVVGYGLTVEIDHGFGFTTLYGHASTLIARLGQEVVRGEVIARVGSTGISASSHLHYEVRVDGVAEDPTTYILPEAVTN